MDLASVDRILAAVGGEHITPSLDRSALLHDLDWSGTWYEQAKTHSSDGRRKKPDQQAQGFDDQWTRASASLIKELSLNEHSALNWLVGERLTKVFATHFERPAALSRDPNTGEPRGPYIRFAAAVLGELNIKKTNGDPYSLETIARAMKDLKTGRARKRGGK
jgi:hypothetical protein